MYIEQHDADRLEQYNLLTVGISGHKSRAMAKSSQSVHRPGPRTKLHGACRSQRTKQLCNLSLSLPLPAPTVTGLVKQMSYASTEQSAGQF